MLAGLLSVLDALMDCPMEKALQELRFADEVRAALLRHEGRIGAEQDRQLGHVGLEASASDYFEMPMRRQSASKRGSECSGSNHGC